MRQANSEGFFAPSATALGAVWSSCSPDFGAKGVVDRFAQIRPKVLLTADGYRYAGKEIDSLSRVREVCERIPEIERVIEDAHTDASWIATQSDRQKSDQSEK